MVGVGESFVTSQKISSLSGGGECECVSYIGG